jgi:hypothetical protein
VGRWVDGGRILVEGRKKVLILRKVGPQNVFAKAGLEIYRCESYHVMHLQFPVRINLCSLLFDY